MTDRDDILAAAKAAPRKVRIEQYREAVEVLREKGYTWREVADFLTEQGVQTDHTRVYRMFGEKSKRRTESREVEILRMTFLGERTTKKGGKWNVLELELRSKLARPVVVIGHAWGTGAPKLVLDSESSVTFRDATLITKSGSGIPMAYIKAELQLEDESWSTQDVHIMPKWEELL